MNVNFFIVGCGNIAHRHAKVIREHPDASLVGVYDTDIEKSQAFAKEYTTKHIARIEYLFMTNRDTIFNICTPNGTHYEVAKELLEADGNVLIEKPMALKRRECDELIKLQKERALKMYIVKQNRFNPPVVELKKNLEKLGKIYSIQVNCFWNRNKDYYQSSTWKGKLDMDGGTLYTQFSHFVDIIHYLVGVPGIQYVNISNKKLDIEFEDMGSVVFNVGEIDGVLNYSVLSYEQNMEGSLLLMGENGTVKIGGKYMNAVEYQQGIDLKCEESSPANSYGYYEGSMSNHDKYLDNVIRNFLDGDEMINTPLEAAECVQTIETIYEFNRRV